MRSKLWKPTKSLTETDVMTDTNTGLEGEEAELSVWDQEPRNLGSGD